MVQFALGSNAPTFPAMYGSAPIRPMERSSNPPPASSSPIPIEKPAQQSQSMFGSFPSKKLKANDSPLISLEIQANFPNPECQLEAKPSCTSQASVYTTSEKSPKSIIASHSPNSNSSTRSRTVSSGDSSIMKPATMFGYAKPHKLSKPAVMPSLYGRGRPIQPYNISSRQPSGGFASSLGSSTNPTLSIITRAVSRDLPPARAQDSIFSTPTWLKKNKSKHSESKGATQMGQGSSFDTRKETFCSEATVSKNDSNNASKPDTPTKFMKSSIPFLPGINAIAIKGLFRSTKRHVSEVKLGAFGKAQGHDSSSQKALLLKNSDTSSITTTDSAWRDNGSTFSVASEYKQYRRGWNGLHYPQGASNDSNDPNADDSLYSSINTKDIKSLLRKNSIDEGYNLLIGTCDDQACLDNTRSYSSLMSNNPFRNVSPQSSTTSRTPSMSSGSVTTNPFRRNDTNVNHNIDEEASIGTVMAPPSKSLVQESSSYAKHSNKIVDENRSDNQVSYSTTMLNQTICKPLIQARATESQPMGTFANLMATSKTLKNSSLSPTSGKAATRELYFKSYSANPFTRKRLRETIILIGPPPELPPPAPPIKSPSEKKRDRRDVVSGPFWNTKEAIEMLDILDDETDTAAPCAAFEKSQRTNTLTLGIKHNNLEEDLDDIDLLMDGIYYQNLRDQRITNVSK